MVPHKSARCYSHSLPLGGMKWGQLGVTWGAAECQVFKRLRWLLHSKAPLCRKLCFSSFSSFAETQRGSFPSEAYPNKFDVLCRKKGRLWLWGAWAQWSLSHDADRLIARKIFHQPISYSHALLLCRISCLPTCNSMAAPLWAVIKDSSLKFHSSLLSLPRFASVSTFVNSVT